MDAVKDSFTKSIVSLVMSKYFPDEIPDPQSLLLPKKLQTKIAYIVENSKLEIFFLFTRDFHFASLDIEDDIYSDVLNDLQDDFWDPYFDAYEFLWFCIFSSCYAALARMRNCTNSVDKTIEVIDENMQYLKDHDLFTDQSWEDIEVAADLIIAGITKFNNMNNVL